MNLRFLGQLLALAGIVVIGASAYRPVLKIPISDMIFFALFVWMIAVTVAQINMSPRLMLGSGLVALGGLISSPDSFSPADSVVNLTKFLFAFIVLLLFIPNLFVSQRSFNWVCWAAVISGAVNGAAAMVEYRVGHHLLGQDVGNEWRMLGLSGHPNELGGHCALMAVVGLCLLGQKQKPTVLISVVGLVILNLLGVALSVSVAGAVSVAAGAAAYIVLQRSGRLLVLAGATGLIFVFSYSVFFSAKQTSTSQNLMERITPYLSSSSRISDTTVGARLETYRDAFASIESNPLVGVGSDEQSATTKNGNEVHNLFLLAWYQTGIMGFLGVLLIAMAPLVLLWYSYRNLNISLRHLTSSLIALWLATFLIDIQGPVFFQRIFWLPFAIIEIYILNAHRWRRAGVARQPDTARVSLAQYHAR